MLFKDKSRVFCGHCHFESGIQKNWTYQTIDGLRLTECLLIYKLIFDFIDFKKIIKYDIPL